MSANAVLLLIGLYFALLLSITYFTARKATHGGYLFGNKQTAWWVLAFGLIGDSLSGVTFVSVPGAVGQGQFAYMQMVLGYVPGYWVISELLLPLYYKHNVTSIYTILERKMGATSQKTGSFFFLLSRTIGASYRLYIALLVLNVYLFSRIGLGFEWAAVIIITLIFIYTIKGGIKTLVWTDMLQSGFLLAGVGLSVVFIAQALKIDFSSLPSTIANSNYSQVFFLENPLAKSYFWKQFLGGAIMAIAMTGLDQNMMQKNLSAKTLAEAQKNIRWFSVVVVLVNLVFVSLGALLYMYAGQEGIAIPKNTDELFPMLALNYLGTAASVVFLLGITAATFSSADSVLTTLTTSYLVDMLGYKNEADFEKPKVKALKNYVHFGFAVIIVLVIVAFREWNNDSVINQVFFAANLTYGPLVGLFAFALFIKRGLNQALVPIVCIIAPLVSFYIDYKCKQVKNGYMFGNELMIVNAVITLILLLAISKKLPSVTK